MRRRFTLKFRAEFYARRQTWEVSETPEAIANKAWQDGYRARTRDEKANRKKAKK